MTHLDYLRIPYQHLGRDFSGCDCLGLVLLYYRQELGIELPDHRDYDERWFLKDALLITRNYRKCGFRKVTGSPRPGDVLLINAAGRPKHLAVAIESGYLLHTTTAGTACHTYRQGRLATAIHSIYRHTKDTRPCV